MNTYPTYHAAKIANPTAHIYVDDQGNFIPGFDVFGRKPGMFCAHTDYCISVSQFLSEGHKGVEGDLYIVGGGCVLEIGKTINEHRFNDPKAKNGDMYVLKSKALEETKSEVEMNTYTTETPEEKEALDSIQQVKLNEEGLPPIGAECWFNFKGRSPELCTLLYIGNEIVVYADKDGTEWSTFKSEVALGKLENQETKTYRYEKVTDSIFDLKEEFERGELFNSKNAKSPIDELEHLAAMFVNGTLYRRIEVTERELFIETYKQVRREFAIQSEVAEFSSFLADSGKFKLVNGKG